MESIACDFCGTAYDADSDEVKKFIVVHVQGATDTDLMMCGDCFVQLFEENM